MRFLFPAVATPSGPDVRRQSHLVRRSTRLGQREPVRLAGPPRGRRGRCQHRGPDTEVASPLGSSSGSRRQSRSPNQLRTTARGASSTASSSKCPYRFWVTSTSSSPMIFASLKMLTLPSASPVLFLGTTSGVLVFVFVRLDDHEAFGGGVSGHRCADVRPPDWFGDWAPCLRGPFAEIAADSVRSQSHVSQTCDQRSEQLRALLCVMSRSSPSIAPAMPAVHRPVRRPSSCDLREWPRVRQCRPAR